MSVLFKALRQSSQPTSISAMPQLNSALPASPRRIWLLAAMAIGLSLLGAMAYIISSGNEPVNEAYQPMPLPISKTAPFVSVTNSQPTASAAPAAPELVPIPAVENPLPPPPSGIAMQQINKIIGEPNTSVSDATIAGNIPATALEANIPSPAVPMLSPDENLRFELQRARLELDAQRATAALVIYNDLARANPQDVAVRLGQASALQSMGRLNEAEQIYNTLLTENPQNETAQINLMGILAQRSPQQAVPRLRQMLQNGNSNPRLYAQLGLAQARLGRSSEAVQALEQAQRALPRDMSILQNLAIAYDRAGMVPEATTAYEQLLRNDTELLNKNEIRMRLLFLRGGKP